MARKIPVAYKMTADTKNAQKEFKKMEKGLGGTGKAGKLAGAGIAAGLAGALIAVAALKKAFDLLSAGLKFVGRTIKESIGLAAVQEVAMTKLTAALNRAGESGRGAADDFAAFARAQQKLTGVGDEVTIAAASVGASFGLTGQTLKDTTKAALDLAVGTGKGTGGLTNAMLLLGKAAKGDFGSLSRYGIVIDASVPKSEKFAKAIELINQQFGGAAAEAAKTYQGRIDIATASFGDMKEEIGFVFTKSQLFNAAIGTITEIIDTLGGKIKENREVMQEWIERGWNVAFAIIDKTVQAGGFLAKGLIVLMEGWKLSKALFDALIISPFKDLIGIVKGFVENNQAAIAEGWQVVGEFFRKWVIQPFKDLFQKIAEFKKKLGFDDVKLPEWLTDQKVFADVGDAFRNLATGLESGFANVNAATDKANQLIQDYKTNTEITADTIQTEYQGKIVPAIDAGTEASKKAEKQNFAMAKSFGVVVGQVISGQKNVKAGFKSVALSALDAMEKIVIAQAVEAAAKQGNSVMGIPPPVGPALAIVAAAAAFALIKGLLTKAEFAEGGLIGDRGGIRRVVGGVPGVDSVPILAQQDELVLPVPMVRQLSALLGRTGPGGRSGSSALPVFQGGGFVPASAAGATVNAMIVVEDSGSPLSSAQRRMIVNDVVDEIAELARTGRFRTGGR